MFVIFNSLIFEDPASFFHFSAIRYSPVEESCLSK